MEYFLLEESRLCQDDSECQLGEHLNLLVSKKMNEHSGVLLINNLNAGFLFDNFV